MAKPLVSAGMVVKALGVTQQAARRIVGELGLGSAVTHVITYKGGSDHGIGKSNIKHSLAALNLATGLTVDTTPAVSKWIAA
jgi:hypothetical protein